jgi:hypothetical protein
MQSALRSRERKRQESEALQNLVEKHDQTLANLQERAKKLASELTGLEGSSAGAQRPPQRHHSAGPVGQTPPGGSNAPRPPPIPPMPHSSSQHRSRRPSSQSHSQSAHHHNQNENDGESKH